MRAIPSIPSLVFTALIFVTAVTPMIAALVWYLRPTRTLSQIIQDARR